MMRTLRVALIALFLATAVASAKDRPAHPILGLVWSGGGKLAWLDPLTLEPVREAAFRFPSGYYACLAPQMAARSP